MCTSYIEEFMEIKELFRSNQQQNSLKPYTSASTWRKATNEQDNEKNIHGYSD